MVTRVKGHEELASLISLLMAVTHRQPPGQPGGRRSNGRGRCRKCRKTPDIRFLWAPWELTERAAAQQ
ncbi:hypothetical protein R6Z07F_000627 [Ovis aries]